MSNPKHNQALEAKLSAMLDRKFPGIEVSVASSPRWGRLCATFRWTGFEGLLPEERFHRLTTVIPEDFRLSKMQGVVWVELAPNEGIDAYLKLPRSEDIGVRAGDIYGGLKKIGLFLALEQALGRSPEKSCCGDFSAVAAILAEKDYPPTEVSDVKLLFIRHGAYCDCQVAQTVQAQLAEEYADVA